MALIALAGCFGGGKDTQDPADLTVAPEAQVGLLRGVVVDDAVRPLAANVTLLPLNRTTTSGPDGSFAFTDVAPGAYLVQAALDGYLGSQVSASVLAGQASDVRVFLSKIASQEPYGLTFPFEGFVQASSGLLGAGTQTLPPNPAGAGQCQCTFQAAAEPGLSRLVLEASWTDWMGDPTGPTEFIWQVEALGANATAQGTGTSPLHVVLGSLDFPADGFRLGNATAFEVRIYPDAVWPAVSQTYDAFLTLWYNGPPPEGWSIIQET